MIHDFYLYEFLEDYQNASSQKEQDSLFERFCQALWSGDGQPGICERAIRFRIRRDLLQTDAGRLFSRWSNLTYTGYPSVSLQTDWCSLIRQKINNLYTRYFDRRVILNKDYLELLHTPQRLYFRWAAGEPGDPQKAAAAIDAAMTRAEALKTVYQQQKMELSWSEYQRLIEGALRRILLNCKPLAEYEAGSSFCPMYDFIEEDHLYIRYICRCLQGELQKWQKQYYGLRDHRKYRRCADCQGLFELRSYNQQRCSHCQTVHNRKNRTQKQRIYRQAKLRPLSPASEHQAI